LFASKAKDCEIEINGKWLIDTSMACGSRILGHSFLGNSIYEFIDNGSVYIETRSGEESDLPLIKKAFENNRKI